MKKPVILCILDGWGYSADTFGNAIELGHAPNWHKMLAEYPHSLLEASGRAVGLPTGQMGNSEVGHTNIGAGRVVMQLLGEIEQALEDGTLATNPALEGFMAKLKSSGGACHLWGLISPGGVHSHQEHIFALAKVISNRGIPLMIHAVCDGRDVAPKSAIEYIAKLEDLVKTLPNAKIATISGRYYAMDRNKTWDRVKLAYDALVSGATPKFTDPVKAIEDSYAADITDEFIKPASEQGYGGMNDSDGLLIANFRADRVREIAEALVDPNFTEFPRAKVVRFAATLGIAEYSEELNAYFPAMFPPQNLPNVLGEVVANAGLKQLRIAETEKYAHVTFFFNGGREETFPGEERILIPSPAVATYDLKPEMSAYEITAKLEEVIAAGTYDVIIVNYANGDMVGHTGILEAGEKAVAAVDECIGRLEAAVLKAGGVLLITADHGNVEAMQNPDGSPKTAHTTSPVECVIIGDGEVKTLSPGALCNIAPTILKILGIKQPEDMSCPPLF